MLPIQLLSSNQIEDILFSGRAPCAGTLQLIKPLNCSAAKMPPESKAITRLNTAGTANIRMTSMG